MNTATSARIPPMAINPFTTPPILIEESTFIDTDRVSKASAKILIETDAPIVDPLIFDIAFNATTMIAS